VLEISRGKNSKGKPCMKSVAQKDVELEKGRSWL
jgi:hypothetical protein